jgi:glycosyltransferase involved in cell wall biosynthesis
VTSSLHEGFCIPVIEAMGCGKPVVGTHATALPETIGLAGLTFRPEDPTDLASKVLEILRNHYPIPKSLVAETGAELTTVGSTESK